MTYSNNGGGLFRVQVPPLTSGSPHLLLLATHHNGYFDTAAM
jgi:hypothetical protein